MGTQLLQLRSCRVTIKAGATANSVYVIVRRVPAGYLNPDITISDNLTQFVDVPDVMGYGTIQLYGAINDVWNLVDVRLLNSTLRIHPGDRVIVQVVSNTASTGQTYSLLVEFGVANL